MGELLYPNTQKIETTEEQRKKEEKEKQELQEKVMLLKEERRLERMKKNPQKATKSRLIRQEKMRKALAMRMRNITIDEIANRLKASPATVGKWLRECFLSFPEENSDTIKKVLNRNITQLMNTFQTSAVMGDVKSAEIALKSINQMAKLSGLNITRKEVEQTNLGEVSPGLDISSLNLDLETKKKLLQAIREKREQDAKNGKIEQDEQDEEAEQYGDEEVGS